jgi:hypothetical protein
MGIAEDLGLVKNSGDFLGRAETPGSQRKHFEKCKLNPFHQVKATF